MNRIGNFEKVSFEQFEDGILNCIGEYVYNPEEVRQFYEDIKIPERATSGSAGYDFYCPIEVDLEPGKSVTIPTGIRAKMDEGWVLMIFPRSGLGFKYHMVLQNTVGIIDRDYAYSDNEGHIMAKICNEGGRHLHIGKNERFCQGIFVPFGITDFDNVNTSRNGGMGSTGK